MFGRNSAIIPGKYKSITTTELIPREFTDYIPVKRRSFIIVPASSISSYSPQAFPSFTPEISSTFNTSGDSPYIQTQPTYTQQNPIYNSFLQPSINDINPNFIGNEYPTQYTQSPNIKMNEDSPYIRPAEYTLIQNIPNYNLNYLRDLNINISDISFTDPLLNNLFDIYK